MIRPRRLTGFTFIELLVVISTIVLLIGIFLPALESSRSESQELQCLTQVRALVQGGFAYQADNGTMPPVWPAQTNHNIRSGPIWLELLARNGYLGKDETLDIFRCPIVESDLPKFISKNWSNKSDTHGVFTYGMNSHIGGVIPSQVKSKYTLTPRSTNAVRKPSQTMLIGERFFPATYLHSAQRVFAAIGSPSSAGIPHPKAELDGGAPFEFWGFQLNSRSGTNNFGFADGSARAVTGDMIDPRNTTFDEGDELIIDQPFVSEVE